MALVPEYIWDAYTRLNAMIFANRDRIRWSAHMLSLMDNFVAYIDLVLSHVAETGMGEDEHTIVRGIMSEWVICVNVQSNSIKLRRTDMHGEIVTDARMYQTYMHDSQRWQTYWEPDAHKLPEILVTLRVMQLR